MAVEPRDVLVAPPRMVGGGEAWEAAEADVLDDGGAEGLARMVGGEVGAEGREGRRLGRIGGDGVVVVRVEGAKGGEGGLGGIGYGSSVSTGDGAGELPTTHEGDDVEGEGAAGALSDKAVDVVGDLKKGRPVTGKEGGTARTKGGVGNGMSTGGGGRMPTRPRRGARGAAATLAAYAVIAEAVGGVGAMEDGGGEEHAREEVPDGAPSGGVGVGGGGNDALGDGGGADAEHLTEGLAEGAGGAELVVAKLKGEGGGIVEDTKGAPRVVGGGDRGRKRRRRGGGGAATIGGSMGATTPHLGGGWGG